MVQQKQKLSERKAKRQSSQQQARQRELSWALYVTEGYVANLHHLMAVNAATMNVDDLKIVQMAARTALNISKALRVSMQNTETVPPAERRAVVQWVMKQENNKPTFPSAFIQ